MYEWKQPKLWLDEECSYILDQRMQAKKQGLWNLNKSSVDNLNNVRC